VFDGFRHGREHARREPVTRLVVTQRGPLDPNREISLGGGREVCEVSFREVAILAEHGWGVCDERFNDRHDGRENLP